MTFYAELWSDSCFPVWIYLCYALLQLQRPHYYIQVQWFQYIYQQQMNIEENVGNVNTKLIYLQSQWKWIIYSTEPSEIELWIIILIVSLVLLCCCCPLLLLLAVSENFSHTNPLVQYILCLARLKHFWHVFVVAVIGSA